ncbi:MAG: hypothetical protein HC832_06760 [Leptolyngbyaceae cyanobacterium RM1_405_57]|nr:hypothetical protein [Leptolyngbyaceae cyanobacterium RM1_405_57]
MGSLLSQRSPSPQEAQTYSSSAVPPAKASVSPPQAPLQNRLTAAPQETSPAVQQQTWITAKIVRTADLR